MTDLTVTLEAETPAVVAANAFAGVPEQHVPLNTLGIAWENLRAEEPADENIPQLASTIFGAGLLEPLWCRPGTRKETKFQVLDGRRRLFAFQHLLSEGLIAEDHPVRVRVLTDRAAQMAAVVLPNNEREPTHFADVISAIGRLKKRKMTTSEIAKALGYSAKEIQGWQALADLEPEVIAEYRRGKLTLQQAKLLTRVDAEGQRSLAQQARNGWLYDHYITARISRTGVSLNDPRVRLVGIADYTAAGGRVEQDLFELTPDRLLDAEILQSVFDERLKVLTDRLKDTGLEVFTAGGRAYQAPEGFDYVDHQGPSLEGEQAEAVALKEEALNALQAQLPTGDEPFDLKVLGDYLVAQIELEIAQRPDLRLGAVVVYPCEEAGVEITVFAHEDVEPEEDEGLDDLGDDGEGGDDDVQSTAGQPRREDVVIARTEVDVEGRTNALHERYTDVATRGLIRAVADDPMAALTLLLARLFCNLALESAGSTEQSISTIKATRYHRHAFEPIDALDGDVTARLAARRQEYLASGLRPIAWINELAHGDKMTLLAELTAISLDGREFASTNIRHGARAEATEMVELTDHRITNYWTPDLTFFGAHTKKGLNKMLEAMGGSVAAVATLKKDDLAAHVTEEAATAVWAPDALSWRQTIAEVEAEAAEDADTPASDEASTPEADVANDGAAEAGSDLSQDQIAEDLPAAA